MVRKIDVMMAKWFLELRDTWREAAKTVARAAKKLYPEAEVYVIGSVAEDRFTATSDLDILVVLPYDPDPRQRLRIKIEIMKKAFDEGLSLYYPVDLHIAGPHRLQEYKKYAKKMIRLDTDP